jgi:hypothetical protein
MIVVSFFLRSALYRNIAKQGDEARQYVSHLREENRGKD